LAGKSVVKPIGAILTVAMMLECLGINEASSAVEKAVCESIAQGETTRDLGGSLSTTEAGRVICRRIERQ
jgi:isocitrate/isopropylmalate dehydrogenase